MAGAIGSATGYSKRIEDDKVGRAEAINLQVRDNAGSAAVQGTEDAWSRDLAELRSKRQDKPAKADTQFVRSSTERPLDVPERQVRNADGTLTAMFTGGSSVDFDRTGRVATIKSAFGRQLLSEIQLDYKDASVRPAGYTLTDGQGNVQERVSGKQGGGYNVERRDASGKLQLDTSMDITNLTVMPNGQLGMTDRNGLFYERTIAGNLLQRDFITTNRRIMRETTPSGRITEYTYQGGDVQPNTFSVKDAQGNIVEHGARKGKEWTIYHPEAGQVGLNPKQLEDSKNAEKLSVEQVIAVALDQRSGYRTELHRSGDYTYQLPQDDRTYRINTDGSRVVIGKGPNGRPQMESFRDHDGAVTSYEYDKDGNITRQYFKSADSKEPLHCQVVDPKTNKWYQFTLVDGKKWNYDGKIVERTLEVGPHGSILQKHPGKNEKYAEKGMNVLLNPNGSYVLQGVGQDGVTRTLQTLDCHGRDTQFSYNAQGKLEKLTVTSAKGEVTEFQSQTVKDQEVWMKNGVAFKLDKVESDGSTSWTDIKSGKHWRIDMSGIAIEVQS